MKIHPTAFISPEAEIGKGVEIGPYCIVESGAIVGDGCRLVSHVSIKEGTQLGLENEVGEYSVLGGLAQYKGETPRPGNLRIGNRNVFREHVTVHRALHEQTDTTLGDNCLLMVGTHVAHDCQVGSDVVLTNGVMVGGHVQVGDRACLGGNTAVHQFCRIGRLAMVGGCTKVVQDVPPFVLTDGPSSLIVGLNRVGLRRAGFQREEILELKAAYRLIYRKGLTFNETLTALRNNFSSGVASEFAEFFESGQRGFVQERRSPPRVALRVHPAVDDAIDEAVAEGPSTPPSYRAA